MIDKEFTEYLEPKMFLHRFEEMVYNATEKEFEYLYDKYAIFTFNGIGTKMPFDMVVFNTIANMIIENEEESKREKQKRPMIDKEFTEYLEPDVFLRKLEEMVDTIADDHFEHIYSKSARFVFNGIGMIIPFSTSLYNAIVDIVIENYGPFIKYRASYIPSDDVTVIFEDIYRSPNGECLSTEVVGFYHGEPDDKATELYKHKPKAVYTEIGI